MKIGNLGTLAIEIVRDCGGNHTPGTSGQWLGRCTRCGQPC